MRLVSYIAIGLIILGLILFFSTVFTIAKSAQDRIRLVKFQRGKKLAAVYAAVTVIFIWCILSWGKLYSECDAEIADYRERGTAVYTEQYTAVTFTFNDEEAFVAQQIDELEHDKSEYKSKILMHIALCICSMTSIISDIILVTNKGIVRAGSNKKENFIVEGSDDMLTISVETKKRGFVPICKIKNTSKNHEILSSYMKSEILQ